MRTVAPHDARDARRRVRRYPFSMAGRILFTEGDRKKREHLAIIEVSIDGIMGLIEEEIPRHAEVCIELDPEGTPFALQGRVRHCTSAVGGFKVGVELVFDDRARDRGVQKSEPFGGMEPEA
jgi:hypothetical protein